MYFKERKLFAMAILATVTASKTVFAETGDLKLHGFLSTGVTGTTRDDHNVSSPVPSTFNPNYHKRPDIEHNTLMGLNVNAKTADDWSMAAQFLIDGANYKYPGTQLDWAFMTYQPNDHVSVRAGRQKTPLWMLSDYIDVHKDHPWTSPPIEVYELFPIRKFDGIGATFSTKINDIGISVDPFYGTVNLADVVQDDTVSIKAPRMYGAALNLDFDFIKVRGSYLKSEWDLTATSIGGGTQLWSARKFNFLSAGVQGEKSGVLLMGEYTKLQDQSKGDYEDLYASTNTTITNLNALSKCPSAYRGNQSVCPGSVSMSDASIATAISGLQTLNSFYGEKYDGMTGYYLTLGYRATDKFLPALTYASSSLDQSQHDYFMKQNTLQLDLGYDISGNTNVKAEGRRVTVFKGYRSQFSSAESDDTSVNTYALQINTTF